jgi:fucose 4-O-acetylase-like acetyltransferase
MPEANTIRAASPADGRTEWIDELRTFVIVLVVNMHACVTYSHVGSWYVNDGPDPGEVARFMFILWQGHLQSFFMGILFLVAGFLAERSLSRKGPRAFIRERLRRLGVPTLVYMVVLNPLINLVINPAGNDIPSPARAYLRYLGGLGFLGGSGPMWFAAALLIFSLALAAFRAMRPGAAAGTSPPGAAAVALCATGLAAGTFLVRTVQPIGQSVMNMQLCYFPQYMVAFIVGVASARGGWLEPLARSSVARRAGWAGLFAGPVVLAVILVAAGQLASGNLAALVGGWNPAALSLAAWEQVTGTCLGLGALAFCSTHLNQVTRTARWLSDRSFGIYLFHPVVLVLATLALRPLAVDPFVKVSLLTAAGLAGSALVADIARRLPGVRAFL